MEVYTKHNFYKNFVEERVKGIRCATSTEKCREVSPWDRVGAESDLAHTKEVKDFIAKSIGDDYTIVNKFRHFNLCMRNPYNFAHIHYDDYDYIMVIYLNFRSQYTSEDGTRIVSHKEDYRNIMSTRIADDIQHYYKDFRSRETFQDLQAQEEAVFDSEYMHPDEWNVDLFIPMVENKAVMFECRYLHSETNNFGDCMSSGRLVEIVYVNKGK